MIGPGGVGKSSLLRGLMNQRLVQDAVSTILADTKVLKPQFWAKGGESGDSYWTEVTDHDEIQELAELLQLVVLAKKHPLDPSHTATVLKIMVAAAAVGEFYPQGYKTQSIQTIGDEYVSSIKDTVVQNVLQQVVKHAISNPSNRTAPKSEVLIHVWDCGGQPVFLDVLPAFLTSRTMFLLFFDARQNLFDKCSPMSYKAGRVVSKTEQSFTTLQLLTQWMASIHAMCTRKDTMVDTNSGPSTASSKGENPDSIYDNKGQQISGRNQLEVKEDIIPKFPRIIPVGTHGDDPEVQKQITDIHSILLSHCENKAYANLLLDGVIVDNTTAGHGKEAEDKGFNYIRKRIHQLASQHLAVRTPVSWVLFRKVLQKVAKDEPIVSYDKAVAVGQACMIAEDVVPSVLHFYHELAVFLHFAQIESLSNHVIADPQWLIRQLGKLLAPEGLETKVFNQLLWKPLREYGIVVQSLYEELWEGINLTPRSLADLLEHFLLAVPIDPPSSVTSYKGLKYFIPSVLQLSMQDTDDTPCSKEILKISSPLHLTFSTQYVPPGFFTRLATTLTREPKCEPLFKQGVYRNKITFRYGEVGQRVDKFTIFEQSSSVQIKVVRTKHLQSHMTFGNTCCEIMQLIRACSTTVCQWLPSIKMEAAFLCEQCQDKNHFITIPPGTKTDSHLYCEADELCDLTREKQYWLKIPNTPQVCC